MRIGTSLPSFEDHLGNRQNTRRIVEHVGEKRSVHTSRWPHQYSAYQTPRLSSRRWPYVQRCRTEKSEKQSVQPTDSTQARNTAARFFVLLSHRSVAIS